MRNVLILALCAGCGDKVSSDREAEVAWLGLEQAIDRALALGLKGFSEADSANIATQTDDGDVSGTMTIDGKVDQGSSDNKGLRLDMALEDYADEVEIDLDEDGEDDELEIVYETNPDDPPYLDLKLRDVPNGTIEGTVLGDFAMDGDLEGVVALSLTLDGALEADPEIDGGTRIAAGELSVTGSATTEDGDTYEIDVTH